MNKTGVVLIAIVIVAASLLGCADGSGPSGNALNQLTSPTSVSLSFAGRSASVSAPATIAASAAASTATDVLEIDTAQVVLRKIELQTAVEDDCEDNPSPSTCAEFQAGPVLLSIPTDTTTKMQVAVKVADGTYHGLEFQIHKVSSQSPDEAAFRTAHPEFVDKSVRVVGKFNGTGFTFSSDVTAVQELMLDPALVVTDSTVNTNLTVRVNLGDWFRAADGSLIDPSTANKGGPNENIVKRNIRQSLRAFEDRNRDGDDDHGEHEAQDSTGDHHSGGDEHGGDHS